jgi:hypothetical protein
MKTETMNIKDIKTAPWDSMGDDLAKSAQIKPYINVMTALIRQHQTNADFREACRRQGIDESSVVNLVRNDAMLNTLAEGSTVFADAIGAVDRLETKDRYTNRVRSALAWALSDFDTATISLDLRTMPAEDLEQFKQEIRFRMSQLEMLDDFLARTEQPAIAR